MTREQKLALIVGFSLILFVGVLISDHLSSARKAKIAKVEPENAVAPLNAGPITPPGPASDTHVAAPSVITRDPLDMILNPTPLPAPQTPANTQIAGANPAPQSAPPAPQPNTLAARSQEQPLIDEVRQLGGDIARAADGVMTIKLPAAADMINRPMTSPLPVDPPAPLKKTIATPVGPLQPLKTHEVRTGDTLFQITQRYYGNGNLWRDLAKFNNMDREGTVHVGSRLKIPSKDVLLGKSSTLTSNPDSGVKMLRPTDPAPKAQPPKTTPSRDRAAPKIELASYTVQKGDTLGVISQRKLGSAKRWQEIAELNNLDDEDDITTGTVLKLPAKRS